MINRKIYRSALLAIALTGAFDAGAQIIPSGSTVFPPSEAVENLPVANNSAAKINYVRQWEPWKPITDATLVPSQPVSDVKVTTMYVDGLGRTIQTVSKQSSAAGKDVISYKVLDAYGREAIQYLPYPGTATDGYFKTNPFAEQKTFYSTDPQYVNEKVYYSKTEFEAAPLGRVVETMPPGNTWAGSHRGTRLSYELNTAADKVKKWSVAEAIGSTALAGSDYPAGTLYKTTSRDEQNGLVAEYKDKEGKILLKKVALSITPGADYDGWLSTYYIYDDFGNLRCVVQPRGVEYMHSQLNWTLTSTLLNEQCFRYEYDNRNRMIIKKVPGAGEVWMVYDKRDRVVMTQDANMRAQNKWMLTQYDESDRPTATGFVNSSNNRVYFQALTTYPALDEVLTQTFYDNYSYSNAKAFDNTDISKLDAGSNPWPETVTKAAVTTGKTTGTKVKVLGTASQYLLTSIYYDDKGRVIQTLADNITGGLDIISNRYDFSGKVLATYHRQTNALSSTNALTRVLTKMSYNSNGTLQQTTKQLNDDGITKIIATNTYSELGQLKTKKLAPAYNGSAGLETMTYDYNLRGWLSGVNKDYVNAVTTTNKFGFTLSYDFGFTKKQYNGNISGTTWRSMGDNELRAFGYDYDMANRLLKADFTQNNGTWVNTQNVDFSVKMGDGETAVSAYDANGNIKSMWQKGLLITTSEWIDKLSYTYKDVNGLSNQLKLVTDIANNNDSKLGDFKYNPSAKTTEDYTYDVNGNMKTDVNKRITNIIYNHLNLPQEIEVGLPPGSAYDGGGNIKYVYDAVGNKLQKEVREVMGINKLDVRITRYIAGSVYETFQGYTNQNVPIPEPGYHTERLQFIGHEEGRIRYVPVEGTTPASYQYDYFVKDQLGNVRMTLSDEVKPAGIYKATMEDGLRGFESLLFTKLTETEYSKPAGFDSDGANAKVSMVNNTSTADRRVGPGVLLKVMAGDKFKASVYGWYQPGATNTQELPGASALINTLANVLSAGIGGTGKVDGGALYNSNVLNTSLDGLWRIQPTPALNQPKAYLTWLVLDEEQFRAVSGSCGAMLIPTVSGSETKKAMLADNGDYITVNKNGYLYVYVSNESQGNVYFDDLKVDLLAGPLLEETHYYPFGLTMAGISSKAAGKQENRLKFNGYEQQNKEFGYANGLEWYDYKNRFYDNQIGRFFVQDRLATDYVYYSPYQFAGNEVPNAIDLDGLEPYYPNQPSGRDLARNLQSNKGESTQIKKPVNNPNGSSISPGTPAMTLSISKGAQFGLKVANIGAEVNFGSKDIVRVSDVHPGKNTADNSVSKKGWGVQVGVVNASKEITSKTEMFNNSWGVPTEKTTSEVSSNLSVGVKNTPFLIGVEKTLTIEQIAPIYTENLVNNSGLQATGGFSKSPSAPGSAKGLDFSFSAIYKLEVKIDFKQLFINVLNDFNTGH